MNRSIGIACAVACLVGGLWGCSGASQGEDDEGYGGSGSYGTSGTGSSTKAGTGTGSNGSYGSTATSGTGSAASGMNPIPSPDPLEPFVPAECQDLDPSQPAVLYLSADDSNSMASPVRARATVLTSEPPTELRTYEFLNYYRIGYPAPAFPDLAIFPDLKPSTGTGEYDLQIGVRSHDPQAQSRPKTITFVLDTSGSMAGARLANEKAVIAAISSQLSAGDIVNAVTWNTENLVAMDGHVVTGPNDAGVASLIANLDANGGTDLEGGLAAGYQLAEAHYGSTRLNRVVLISDGEANVGVTSEDLIAAHAEDADQEGIYLVGVAVGPGGNDVLMDVVTDKGRGASLFVDSPAEATAMFADRFDEVMEVAARGVQVELTLPWYFQMHEFYGEEFSENPGEVEPQHLAPGDAMVFSQVIRACDPSIVVGSDTIAIRATWKTPLAQQPMQTETILSIDELLAAPSPRLAKGKAIVAYAEALKQPTPASIHAAYDAASAANPGATDPELNEIMLVLSSHSQF